MCACVRCGGVGHTAEGEEGPLIGSDNTATQLIFSFLDTPLVISRLSWFCRGLHHITVSRTTQLLQLYNPGHQQPLSLWNFRCIQFISESYLLSCWTIARRRAITSLDFQLESHWHTTLASADALSHWAARTLFLAPVPIFWERLFTD